MIHSILNDISCGHSRKHVMLSIIFWTIYNMHNKFSNFLCFASLCAHLCAISNNFNCNDENRILGK